MKYLVKTPTITIRQRDLSEARSVTVEAYLRLENKRRKMWGIRPPLTREDVRIDFYR